MRQSLPSCSYSGGLSSYSLVNFDRSQKSTDYSFLCQMRKTPNKGRSTFFTSIYIHSLSLYDFMGSTNYHKWQLFDHT